MYAKISKKGQVTIPKKIRKQLKIDDAGGVLFLVEKDEIKIKGVPIGNPNRLAGSLKKYAKQYIPIDQIRADLKGKIADEIAREGLSD